MLSPLSLVKEAKQSITESSNEELCQVIDDKGLIIDVREADEFKQGFIASAINIPRGLIEFAIFDHPLIKPLLSDDISQTKISLYCKSGGRSALAAQSLQKLGFKNAVSLEGGIMGWEKAGFKVDTTQSYQY